jgi:signal transduction histidine kinase
LGLGAGAVTFLFLLSMATVTSLAAAFPPAVGVACVVGLAIASPASDHPATWLVGLPGLVSLATTAAVLATGQELTTSDGLYGLLETAALCALLAGTVRWLHGPRLWVCGVLTALAQVAWIVRFLPDRDVGSLLAGCALWSVPSLVAIVVGGYPRLAAARLRSSVASARAEQQRSLERDMHDYVAHDVTAMIVQAQAAQYAGGDDPERLRAALRRIEEAGHKAMSSMDRALELLRSVDPQTDVRMHHPGLDELDELVGTFGDAGSCAVRLRVDGPVDELPREVSETLYRVCVEALTNVRRHARAVRRVEIVVSVDADQATLSVHDDGLSTTGTRRARGGSGLRSLGARVDALRGTLDAGVRDGGWRVTARLPLRAQDSP